MNKRLLTSLIPLTFLMVSNTSCNKNNSYFNINDNVCLAYLNANSSKEEFNAIYPNIASRTKVGHDYSIPYVIRCKDDGSNDYSFHVSFNEKFENEIIYQRTLPFYILDNLIPGKTYYYKVTSSLSEDVLTQGSFTVNPNNVRWINAPSIGNVRDLGGWELPNNHHIKYGMLYRGRNMDYITNDDKKVIGEKLKIKSQIDLRKDDDSGTPGNKPDIDSIKNYYYYNEMLAYDDIINKIDKELLGPCINPDPNLDGKTLTGKQMVQDIFNTLSNKDNYPIYFHCSAGADRTGTIAFLIEGLLGVNERYLTKDYELTSFCTRVNGGRLRREPNANLDDYDYTKDYYQIDDKEYPTPPSQSYWPRLINEMNNFPGEDLSSRIQYFLTSKCGVAEDKINLVRSILIE